MERLIAILPPHVIDQIAAGEVIERPASVVKELIDNAIDAGATAITVETAAGGRGLVRVTDDGCGMTAAQAKLALERHATSKLRTVDDLWTLSSMGFRGEALPAIASVSRLTLTTRTAAELAATRIVVQASRILEVSEVGAPVGTTIEVVDLLANVPARLKFLKGDATEASHITDLVGRIAMAHPALHLRLKHNGRTALEVPPDRDGLARARALLGGRLAARIVASAGEENGVHVTAFLGAPELAQATARGVQLFVGKRPVRDRGLLHAIAMGYGELIPRGRYPIAIVHVDVPAGAVDVNVHPQKQEVRFSDPSLVASAVRHVVQVGVAAAPWRAELGPAVPIQTMTFVAPPRLPLDGVPATAMSLAFDREHPRMWAETIQREVRASRAAERAEGRMLDLATRAPRPIVPDPAPVETSSGFFAQLRYLGQLDLTYLVCDGDGELVLIDQHSAHERVELERLRAGGHRDVAVQKLLFPVTIEATPDELVQIARPLFTQALSSVGFEVVPCGPTTLDVRSVPAGLRHGDPAEILRGLLVAWAAEGTPTEEDRVERMLAEIACHSVVRAGDSLGHDEAIALLRDLEQVPRATRDPHGRPVVLRLPLAEIARRFGR